jgi:cyclopropane fatty-acyl-phospholipid synthase-like methyltransferase
VKKLNKPYSESCDQNKQPILKVLLEVFSSVQNVLEIGSGTGQHAIYFAKEMPWLKWHTSDCQPYLMGINMWLTDAQLDNVVVPFELDVTLSKWPSINIDAVFTANTLHIMSLIDVHKFIIGVGKLLPEKGRLVIYGPFNYNGSYTSDSNARFDQWLKDRNALSCIKDFEQIVFWATENGMRLVADYEMPANNRILHFEKI